MPEPTVATMPPMQPDQRRALGTGDYSALTDEQLDDMADRALTVGDSAAARTLAVEMNRRKQTHRAQLAAALTGRP